LGAGHGLILLPALLGLFGPTVCIKIRDETPDSVIVKVAKVTEVPSSPVDSIVSLDEKAQSDYSDTDDQEMDDLELEA